MTIPGSRPLSSGEDPPRQWNGQQWFLWDGQQWVPESSVGSQYGTAGLKRCPVCAEEIQAQALLCRFCGASLGVVPYNMPYGAMPYGAQAAAPGASGLAIASLVLGIVWIYGVGSLLAIIFGHVARGQIRRRERIGGSGMALAGLILGYIGLAVLAIVITVAVTTTTNSCNPYTAVC